MPAARCGHQDLACFFPCTGSLATFPLCVSEMRSVFQQALTVCAVLTHLVLVPAMAPSWLVFGFTMSVPISCLSCGRCMLVSSFAFTDVSSVHLLWFAPASVSPSVHAPCPLPWSKHHPGAVDSVHCKPWEMQLFTTPLIPFCWGEVSVGETTG